MKLIIDIPEEIYQEAIKSGYSHLYDEDVANAIAEGTPLDENKGEWIHPYRSDIACECSACHMQMPITDYFNYCPNCGAKMNN